MLNEYDCTHTKSKESQLPSLRPERRQKALLTHDMSGSSCNESKGILVKDIDGSLKVVTPAHCYGLLKHEEAHT